MEFFRNLAEFMKEVFSFRDEETVWRGEDGSYAVGTSFPIDVEEGETDYVEAGNVSEYK